MTIIDVEKEISFQTTRSGGKGGQNVNKVETAVMAGFHIASSNILTVEQKALLFENLKNKISAEGFIQTKSQRHRSQWANKEDAVKKINTLLTKALQRKKPRIATSVSKANQLKRLEAKKRKAETKANRRKWKPGSE